MKKLYLLSTLCACAMTAYSVNPGFTSVDQLLGEYSLIYSDNENSNFEESTMMTAVKGASDNEIVFNNFYYIENCNIPAIVDLEAGTVTFKKAMGFIHMEHYDGDANFLLYEWNSSHTRGKAVDEITATIAEDGTGTIVFDENNYIMIVVPDGINPMPGSDGQRGPQIVFNGGSYDKTQMHFQPMKHEWQYFESQWEYAGQAEFADMWVAPLANFNIGSNELVYKIDYYTNKANPEIVLLSNPYGEGTPWTDANVMAPEYINTSNEPGYIYLDCTDPNLVMVISGVSAGYSNSKLKSFHCVDAAGFCVYGWGYDSNTMKNVLNSFFKAGEFSTRTGNTIMVRNLLYTDKATEATNLYYGRLEPAYVTTITLYPGEENAVDNIMVDEDVPAVFYNLQGIRVDNPEVGQLLICRKGSKTEKLIIR